MAEGERVTIITADCDPRDYWRECWRFRELLWFLARRDLIVRYRQTMAGILWLLVRPAGQVLAFTLLFGVLADFPSNGLPYPIIALSGVTAWAFFGAIVDHSTIALANNANLITKVHFPRLLLPIGTVAPNIVDLAINLVGLLVLMALWGFMPSWRLLLLPVPLAMLGAIALGLGMFFSAASVRYRDFRQLTPFLMQMLFLLSPVGFTTAVVDQRLGPAMQACYYANPLVAAIDCFRWCVQPAGYAMAQDLDRLAISGAVGLLLIGIGQWYFRRLERSFADVI